MIALSCLPLYLIFNYHIKTFVWFIFNFFWKIFVLTAKFLHKPKIRQTNYEYISKKFKLIKFHVNLYQRVIIWSYIYIFFTLQKLNNKEASYILTKHALVIPPRRVTESSEGRVPKPECNWVSSPFFGHPISTKVCLVQCMSNMHDPVFSQNTPQAFNHSSIQMVSIKTFRNKINCHLRVWMANQLSDTIITSKKKTMLDSHQLPKEDKCLIQVTWEPNNH